MREVKPIRRTEKLTIPLRPEELRLIEQEASREDTPAATLCRGILLDALRTRQTRRQRATQRDHRSLLQGLTRAAISMEPDTRTMLQERMPEAPPEEPKP